MPTNKKKKGKKSNDQSCSETALSSTAPALGRNPMTSNRAGVDSLGRMGEREGRHLYKLLTVLTALALPKFNAERSKVGRPQIQWDVREIANNPMESREIMLAYVLQEIDWLLELVENHNSVQQEALIKSILGRRLTAADKMQIASWKVHIKDDFFVVGHLPHQGTILVQVGRLKNKDQQQWVGSMYLEEDFHEPRVFIVQGLADPLKSMTSQANKMFKHEHPSICDKHAEFSDTFALMHTTLLPYREGITYITVIRPLSLGRAQHYSNPRDLAKAVDVAVSTYRAAFPGENDTAPRMATNFKLFQSLDVERDASVKRLTCAATQGVPLTYRQADLSDEDEEDESDPVTCIVANQMMWSPFQDRNNPNSEHIMDKATNTGSSHRHEKEVFCWEGFKFSVGEEVKIHDSEPCPFHKEYGVTSRTFLDCCKPAYLSRVRKAREKGHIRKLHFMFEPVEEEEVERIDANQAPGTTLNLTEHIRLGSFDVGTLKITVSNPESNASIIKERMDTSDVFHSVLENKWVYFGCLPLRQPILGIKIFGDIILDPVSGVFEAEGMTARRMTNLIREMKHICTGLPVAAASLVMAPTYKAKTDMDRFETNRSLLRQDWDHVEITATINKEENSDYGLQCAFCGITEQEMGEGCKLMRCACKQSFYCSKKHQRKHWADHKERCQEIRGAS